MYKLQLLEQFENVYPEMNKMARELHDFETPKVTQVMQLSALFSKSIILYMKSFSPGREEGKFYTVIFGKIITSCIIQRFFLR